MVIVSLCLSVHTWVGGGYPYPIMLCNITQNAMGQTPRGVPISHNALQHFPDCHGADTWGGVPCQVQLGGYPAGGYPARGVPRQGTPSPRSGQGVPCQGVPFSGVPCWGYQFRVPPSQVRMGGGGPLPGGTLPGGTQVGYPPGQVRRGGYPVRTTEGVLTTRRAVCLLHSRRRTFLFTFNLTF